MACWRHWAWMPLADVGVRRLTATGMRLLGGLLPVLVAVGLALLSYAWLQRIAALDDGAGGPLTRRPDYWMDGVSRTLLDANGEVEAVLDATRMTHYPDDDSTALEQPRLALYNGPGSPWRVNAESGWISGDGSVVRLDGAVEIFRLDADGRRRFEILTSDVRLLPRERYAETEAPAVMTGPSTQTHAIGLRANLSRNRLQLLNRVRTVYEPRGYEPTPASR